ncbi:MAG: undecaprenyl-diphosphate phosphatase [Ruminococcaceae bacterium]|nr:undecaprenyl-diphosphate phosphatase [Oscillospiraceae bacterium]
MSIFDAIIQGVVQGLTEFLPVSSSGHLAITQHVMGVTDNNLFFNVMLHIGTLVAVVAFYYKLIWRLIKEFFAIIKDVFKKKFSFKDMNHDRKMIFMLIVALLPLFLLFAPIPGTDMKVKDFADMISGGEQYFIIVGISLLVTSILLILGNVFNNKLKKKEEAKGTLREKGAGKQSLTVVDAIVVGLTQCCAAVFPGLSRSGSTLAAGQLRGVNRQTALDFTFILAIPSILAAAVLELSDALSAPEGIGISVIAIIAGMIASAIVGYLSIVLFKWLLKTNKMIVFIVYTAIVGLAVVIVSIVEMNIGHNIFI